MDKEAGKGRGLGRAHTMHVLEGHMQGFDSYPETCYISPSLTMLIMGVAAHGHSHRGCTTATTFTEHLL